MRRFTLVATIAAGLLFGTSCSKTEDTAPETRLFGDPPEIQNVTLNQAGLGQAVCDYSKALEGFMCLGGVPLNQIQPPFPTITVTVNFSELQFNVAVTDPNSVPGGQSDILLVSASYQRSNQGGTPVETSLVVLDDGGTNSFNYSQQGIEIQEGCTDQPNDFTCCANMFTGDQSMCPGPTVSCNSAVYNLTSNDTTANDGTFTRGFALISNTFNLTAPTGITLQSKSSLALNCVARSKQQFPAFADVQIGQPVSFKIEAVDRAGNLAVWPSQPQATFDQTNFSCTGDDCGCCFLLSSNPDVDCKNRDGLIGIPGSGFEQGLCRRLFP